PNGASAKSRNERTVPVVAWVLAYYDRYTAERLACPVADGCDFVLSGLRDNTNCPESGVIRTSHPVSVPDRPFFDGEVRIIFWLYHIVIN
ncbi:MAG: hypothetical protein ACRDOD_02365, partial [Streptosporangiaceae bacterium]